MVNIGQALAIALQETELEYIYVQDGMSDGRLV